jgi:hypothetical protein
MAMADGGRWLGHEEVGGDPVEVAEGSAGLSTVVRLDREKPATWAGIGGHRWCQSGR